MSLVRYNYILVVDNIVCLLFAQLLGTAHVVRVECSVEEVAHVVDDRTSLAQLLQSAGALAAECRREGAGLDQLLRVRNSDQNRRERRENRKTGTYIGIDGVIDAVADKVIRRTSVSVVGLGLAFVETLWKLTAKLGVISIFFVNLFLFDKVPRLLVGL